MIYNNHMPQTGKRKIVDEDGVKKDAYTVTFTNGALDELEQLQKSIKAPDLDAVLKIAIGITKRVEAMQNERRDDDPTVS